MKPTKKAGKVLLCQDAGARILNEHIYPFDVDDTLVMWADGYHTPGEGKVRIEDPYDGSIVYLKPHERHIKLLKQMSGRNRFIIVWSQAGVQWAEAVVKALGIDAYVNLTMTKPLGYVDDLPSSAWMQNHIYLKLEEES